MTRLPLITGCLLALTLTLTSGLQAAQFYKWTDASGAVKYTDTAPPPGIEYELVRTYGAPGNSKTAIENLENDRKARAEQASLTEQKQKEYEEQKKIADLQAKAKSENCKTAKANHKVLTENHIIRRIGEDGEAVQLSPEQKQAEIDKAQEMIKLNCSNS